VVVLGARELLGDKGLLGGGAALQQLSAGVQLRAGELLSILELLGVGVLLGTQELLGRSGHLQLLGGAGLVLGGRELLGSCGHLQLLRRERDRGGQHKAEIACRGGCTPIRCTILCQGSGAESGFCGGPAPPRPPLLLLLQTCWQVHVLQPPSAPLCGLFPTVCS